MTANGFSSYELFVQIDDFHLFSHDFRPLFMKTHFFYFHQFKYCLQRTLWSDFSNQLLFLFYENRPAKTQFHICPFPTTTRSENSRTPPDRSATTYYVENSRFHPSSMEWKFKISKVLSKTLPRRQFSELTADSLNKQINFQAGC